MAEIEPQVLLLENAEADYEKLIIKELESKAKADVDGARAAGEVQLTTPTTNFTKIKLTKLETKFWAGRTLTSFPDMNNNTTYYFLQKGSLPEGVKWGFSYATGTDSTARKWVAAFDSSAGKAYCECGPTGPVDWNVVEDKLGKSGSSSEYVDPIFGGKITANIDGLTAIATLW